MPILSPQDAFLTYFEPIQKNRFSVNLDGIPAFMVQGVTIPTPTSSVITIDHINISQKVKGKTTFGQFTLTIYNAIAPSTLQAIYEWHRLGHEVFGRDSYADIYKKVMTVDILSPSLEVVNRFSIQGAWISSISGLDFSKSEDGLVNITITGECDYCILEF